MSNQETETHREGGVWRLVSTIGFLWLDRALIRGWPLAFLALFASLYNPSIAGEAIVAMVVTALTWGVADLARGIELDHRHKERTLRDCIVEQRANNE